MKKIMAALSAGLLSLCLLVGCASVSSKAKEGYELYAQTEATVTHQNYDDVKNKLDNDLKILEYVYFEEDGKETIIYRGSFGGTVYSLYFKYVIEGKEGNLKVLDGKDFFMFDNAKSDVTNGKVKGEFGTLISK